MSTPIIPGSEDTIPEDLAIAITTNWRNYISSIDPSPSYVRAFNIPMEDITELSEFYKCPSVRAYLAMTVPGDVTTLKIILVPVDAAGCDILSIPDATLNDQSTIYDFTSPCPQVCDIDSPLFK